MIHFELLFSESSEVGFEVFVFVVFNADILLF